MYVTEAGGGITFHVFAPMTLTKNEHFFNSIENLYQNVTIWHNVFEILDLDSVISNMTYLF